MPRFVNLSKISKPFPSFNHEPIIHLHFVDNNCSTLAPKNIGVKRTRNNIFSRILESTNRNNKGILEARIMNHLDYNMQIKGHKQNKRKKAPYCNFRHPISHPIPLEYSQIGHNCHKKYSL